MDCNVFGCVDGVVVVFGWDFEDCDIFGVVWYCFEGCSGDGKG